MMDFLPFDIETVKNERADEYYQTVYKPKLGTSKQKKGESDKDWEIRKSVIEADDRKAAAEKSALNWPTLKIISIAYKVPGRDIDCIYDAPEKAILESWGNLLEFHKDLQPIGKNSSTFDLPVLVGRFLANDLGIPYSLRKTPRFGTLTDVDHIFSRYRNQTYTLETYGFGMGMEGKMGDGSMVADWYFRPDGPDWDTIVAYNKQDVAIVIEMLRRYRPYKPVEQGSLFNMEKLF